MHKEIVEENRGLRVSESTQNVGGGECLSILDRNAESYRERYPEGTKLRLTAGLEDPYSPKKAGDIFVVDCVDDIGQIHGRWASGGSIALIPEVDSFEICDDETTGSNTDKR